MLLTSADTTDGDGWSWLEEQVHTRIAENHRGACERGDSARPRSPLLRFTEELGVPSPGGDRRGEHPVSMPSGDGHDARSRHDTCRAA